MNHPPKIIDAFFDINVTSQTIICPSLNRNQKNNPKCRPRIPKPTTKSAYSRKGRLFAGLVLGSGILDTALHLIQCFSNDVHSCTVTRQ